LQLEQGEITLLLGKWRDGDPSAFAELLPLVYPHLRAVAWAYLRREKNPGTLLCRSSTLICAWWPELIFAANGIPTHCKRLAWFTSCICGC